MFGFKGKNPCEQALFDGHVPPCSREWVRSISSHIDRLRDNAYVVQPNRSMTLDVQCSTGYPMPFTFSVPTLFELSDACYGTWPGGVVIQPIFILLCGCLDAALLHFQFIFLVKSHSWWNQCVLYKACTKVPPSVILGLVYWGHMHQGNKTFSNFSRGRFCLAAALVSIHTFQNLDTPEQMM